MTTNRMFAGALLAATALSFASPAAAQRIDRIVAFGDSYADTGNFFRFVGINPATGTSGVYTSGRFSGGTNYIDTLAQLLAVPVDNFAVAGALTNNYNTNVGPGLGLPTEVGSFLAGGAGATPFPAVSGTFGANDLLAVSIGANDARLYQKGSVNNGTPGPVIPPGTLAGAPAAGAASAVAATAGLNALVAAGAPTISYLAGSTAYIPEIAAQPDPAAAFAIRNAYYQSFDAAMRTTLAGYAASGRTVHYLDLTTLGQQIQKDFAAYGLTALACPKLPDPTCIAGSANNYVFYADQLHLTSAGFAIVARYIDRQLTAPLTLQAPTDTALDTATQFGRTLTTRMDLGSPRDGDMPEGLGIYAVGDSISRTIDASRRNDQFKVTSVGLTGGIEYGFGSGMVGAAVNVSRPKANFGNDKARDEVKSVQAGIYGGFGIAGGFVQGYAGLGRDRHDITREGVVSQLDASPKGKHRSAGLKAGYLMPMGSFRLGPVVALDHARARVNGYTENGDPVLALNVGGESFSALRGSLGAEMRGDFAGNGVQLRPFAAAMIEKDFAGDGRTFDYAQTSAPTIVNRFAVEDASKKPYGRLSAGLSAAILSNVSLNATVAGTVRKKQGNETTAHLGLRAAF